MIARIVTPATVLLCVAVHAQSGESWRLRSLPAPSTLAQAVLLQTDGDAAPEWGVFDGETLVVADISSDYPPVTYAVPKDASLFDLRDTDRDGKPEMALVRAGRIEYWRDAARVTQDAANVTIEHPALAAFSFRQPRPYPLFVERRGEDFLSVPLGAEPPVWTLEGTRVNPLAPGVEESLALSQFQVWEAVTPPAFDHDTTEFRLSQVYERATPATAAGRSSARRGGGTQRARDAANAPSEDWPSFSISNTERALYALAPPDYRDTLIRVERVGNDGSAARASSSPRRYPGVLIAPQETGADLNADGYADLLLWRAPSPSMSMDAVVRAAQSGTWNVMITVHLYEPSAHRFAARPIEWFQANAPVMRVLEGGVRGPFEYTALEDIDGDGRMDIVTTGAGNELTAWRFTDKREAEPWLSTTFEDPIEEIILTAHVPAYRWLGIARSAGQFHLFALPQH